MTALNAARSIATRAYEQLPEGLRRAVLVKRREPIWIARGIVFIHIPKAAGTSINQALFGRFMGHLRASDITRTGSPALRATPRFAVTRNPWDRLLSAYRFARRGLGVGELVAGIANPAQYQTPAFENFERFITEWLATRRVDLLDGVFRRQGLYVCDSGGSLLVDHLGTLDDLRPTYDFIESIVGPIERIGRTNKSGDEVDYREFYTPRTAAIVGEIYRQDVEAFGYSF
jgi:hypothetical protein